MIHGHVFHYFQILNLHFCRFFGFDYFYQRKLFSFRPYFRLDRNFLGFGQSLMLLSFRQAPESRQLGADANRGAWCQIIAVRLAPSRPRRALISNRHQLGYKQSYGAVHTATASWSSYSAGLCVPPCVHCHL